MRQILDHVRRLLRGHGPAGPLLAAAEDAGLRVTPDGPIAAEDAAPRITPDGSVPPLCGSSAHVGDPTPAEITGWKVGPAIIASSNGRPGRAAYCLRCAALAYCGEAFMPDAEHTGAVLVALARILRPCQET